MQGSNLTRFICEYGWEKLTEELGIRVIPHPTLPLLLANYSQIESPKTNVVVREARGTVTDLEGYPVARGFDRFFNWGEVCDEMPLFDWSDFWVNEKVDGSYIGLFFYEGQWIMHTRGSWADGKVGDSPFTWEQLFCKALGIPDLQGIPLPTGFTYVFELCSRYNKVVRDYEAPQVFLLGGRVNGIELTPPELNALAEEHDLQRPVEYNFHSMDEIVAFLREQEASDPTFEGVVIRDCNNMRWKLKSSTYVALHHMKGAENEFNHKGVLPFILAGETDELLAYFPEVKYLVTEMEARLDEEWAGLETLWLSAHEEVEQKSFALKVKDSRFSGLLFQNRQKKGDLISLADLWRASGDMIFKHLFKS